MTIREHAAPLEAYPLTWPAGAARTPAHERQASRFAKRFHGPGEISKRYDLTVGDEIVALRNEIARMPGAERLVISTNLPTRNDGMPMASASPRDKDPGVAVYWSVRTARGTTPYVMPCDRWRTIADNLHAVALSIEAMRGLDRWGAVKLEQAFAGFAALPPGSGPAAPPPPRPWREVIGGYWPEGEGELDPGEILALARKRFKVAMAAAHPDAGGDADLAVDLNRAMEDAERELEDEAQAMRDGERP